MVDLPGVGENLHDHLLLSNVYAAQEPLPAGANNLLEAQLYTRSRHSEGPAPDLQPVFIHIPYPAEGYPTPKHGYTIAAGLVAPKSRGTLRLASADPADFPLVDPNILAEPHDLDALVEAVEICREIGAAQAFAPWRKAEVAPGPKRRRVLICASSCGAVSAPTTTKRARAKWVTLTIRKLLSDRIFECVASMGYVSRTHRLCPRYPPAIPTRRQS